jgi:hypothetical protein
MSRHFVRQCDPNQSAIVAALRRYQDVSVCPMSSAPPGFPDLVVATPSKTVLLEVKMPYGTDGGKSAHNQKLTPAQEKFHAAWKGKIFIVRSPEEAIKCVFG